MGIQLKSTGDVSSQYVKFLIYGPSGAGKTTLIGTLPKPVVLSAESGLMSLRDKDIPFIEISTIDELKEAFVWCGSDEAKDFDTIAIDSITEIAEVLLSEEKKNNKDPRAAYGALIDEMGTIIRAFRDLPKNVYMSAKVEKVQDDLGKLLYGPSMPGSKLGQQLPYFFDEVYALRVEKGDDGKTMRMLQTDGDGIWSAKSRIGGVDQWEEPDLGEIIKKILA